MDIHLEKQGWGHVIKGLKCHLLIQQVFIEYLLCAKLTSDADVRTASVRTGNMS